jgi:hypothetical protein
MNNEIMPKQILTARSEGTRKRWTDKVEEDLKPMGIRNWPARAGNRKEWKRIVLEAKVHKEL